MPRRVRRIAKWTCALLAAIFVAADIAGRVAQPEWWSRGAFGIMLSGGAAYVWWGGDRAHGGFQPPAGFRVTHPPGARVREWWFKHEPQPVAGWKVETVPIWPLLAAVVAAGAWLFWADRLRRAGLCPSCGYDRRGLAGDAPCPECGAR